MPEGFVLCHWAITPRVGFRNPANESCSSMEGTSEISAGLLWKSYRLLCESAWDSKFAPQDQNPAHIIQWELRLPGSFCMACFFPSGYFWLSIPFFFSLEDSDKRCYFRGIALKYCVLCIMVNNRYLALSQKNIANWSLRFLKGVSNWSLLSVERDGGKITHVRLSWPYSAVRS